MLGDCVRCRPQTPRGCSVSIADRDESTVGLLAWRAGCRSCSVLLHTSRRGVSAAYLASEGARECHSSNLRSSNGQVEVRAKTAEAAVQRQLRDSNQRIAEADRGEIKLESVRKVGEEKEEKIVELGSCRLTRFDVIRLQGSQDFLAARQECKGKRLVCEARLRLGRPQPF